MKLFRGSLALVALVLALPLHAAPGLASPKAASPKALSAGEAKEGVRPILKALALSPTELDQMEKILSRDETALAKNRADLAVLKAQLTRYLLEANPSMEEVGKLLKKSQDLEYQDRIIQIQRQLDVRKLLGDERWASLLKLSRLALDAQKSGRLKDKFDTKGLSEEEVKLWTRLMAYSRRILP